MCDGRDVTKPDLMTLCHWDQTHDIWHQLHIGTNVETSGENVCGMDFYISFTSRISIHLNPFQYIFSHWRIIWGAKKNGNIQHMFTFTGIFWYKYVCSVLLGCCWGKINAYCILCSCILCCGNYVFAWFIIGEILP